MPVALPEISPAPDTSDDGIPRFGSPQAVEKTAEKQAYSRPRQALTRFTLTGQIGSAGVIEFPTMRSRLADPEFVEVGRGAVKLLAIDVWIAVIGGVVGIVRQSTTTRPLAVASA